MIFGFVDMREMILGSFQEFGILRFLGDSKSLVFPGSHISQICPWVGHRAGPRVGLWKGPRTGSRVGPWRRCLRLDLRVLSAAAPTMAFGNLEI